MDLSDAFDTFIAESRDLLTEMEQLLLTLEATAGAGHPDQEELNALFRCAHTIKGSAGIFGLEHIVGFTHVVESLLDQLRDGSVALSSDLIGLLFQSRDYINTLLEGDHEAPDENLLGRGRVLTESMNKYRRPVAGPVAASETRATACHCAVDREADHDVWHISLRFGTEVLRHGMDPLGFIGYLRQLGEVTYVSTITEHMPGVEGFDAETCYLGFEIAMRADVEKTCIEDVFEFVRDECDVRILPPGSRIDEYIALINELPEDNTRLGELLVASGALTARELEDGLARQEAMAGTAQRPIGELLVDGGTVQPEIVNAALKKQLGDRERRSRAHQYVRVQADKLDSLINLVGELVIASAAAGLSAQRHGDTETREAMTVVSGLVEDIRDSALAVRMIPIGETFQRFQRVVRDVAIELGKDIHLDVRGAETELDKTVVDKITDPLTHLIRNAMDHGIEPAEQRVERGKPPQGTVSLNAFHEAGSVVIEVSDDGSGLNRDRILTRAVERGLVNDPDGLSEQDVFRLIFEPGFSTAQEVTNLSGRGVGMDVVKRNIEALRGTVTLASTLERGTTVRIRLPLTLAIIDGLLVGVGDDAYVIPLSAVSECAELDRDASDPSQRNFMTLRGAALPLLELRQLFAAQGKRSRRSNVVVVKNGARTAGLVVDHLLGEHQTVIKPMGRLFEHVQGLSGSTVLGDGRVGLIVDVASLLEQTVCSESRAFGGEDALAAAAGYGSDSQVTHRG